MADLPAAWLEELSELLRIPEMGHDKPRELWPDLADAIAKNADREAAHQPA